MSDVENRELVKRVQAGDKDAARDLVKANIGLIVGAAKKAFSIHLEPLEFFDEAACGLLEAAQRFDHREGVAFSSYAGWWMRAFVTAAARGPLKSRSQQRAFFGLLRAERDLFAEGVTHPSDLEIALRVGVEERAVTEAKLHCTNRGAVDPPSTKIAPGVERAGNWEALVPDPAENIEERLCRESGEAERTAAVRAAVACLEPREADVIAYRFGLGGREETLQEIGTRLGVSRERVRQLETKALEKLKVALHAAQEV